jgi:hypothetical protein
LNTIYITPKETEQLGPLVGCSYPYFEVQKFVTQLAPIASMASNTVISNNIQLNSIPYKIYIYVRRQENDLLNSCAVTDTFFRINSASIQYFAENGILSNASPQQLYQISADNGCNMTFTQWYPTGVYKTGVMPSGAGPLAAPAVFTIGSVLCVNPSFDFGLDSLSSCGKLCQNMIQVTLNVTNVSAATITPELLIVPVYDGIFEIGSLGTANKIIGVITSKDILDAAQKPGYDFNDVKDVSGGNFFTGLKKFFKDRVVPLAKTFIDNQGLSTSLGLVPHPAAKVGALGLKMMGYGEGEGGVLLGSGSSGGRMLMKKTLADRMEKY